jgi:hypothetical protein
MLNVVFKDDPHQMITRKRPANELGETEIKMFERPDADPRPASPSPKRAGSPII